MKLSLYGKQEERRHLTVLQNGHCPIRLSRREGCHSHDQVASRQAVLGRTMDGTDQAGV